MVVFDEKNGEKRVDIDIPGSKLTDREKPVSYTHLRAHETVLDLVCRLLLEKKKQEEHIFDICMRCYE